MVPSPAPSTFAITFFRKPANLLATSERQLMMTTNNERENHSKVISDPSTCEDSVELKTVLAIAYLQDQSVPFISSGSSAWATKATAYNLRVPATPALVIYAQTVRHVQVAIDCGVTVGLKVSARSGGHSYTSLGLGGENDHLVVDLTGMSSISVDGNTHIATIGAGARLGDVARELFNKGGRAISHGSCPAVGLSGHILHGGYGWASHSHGLALDWMVGAGVVLANGMHVHCSETENSDLFWALRGAGSNFGIVTSYELATFEAPAASIPFKVSLEWGTEGQKLDGITALVQFARDMPAELNMRLIMHDSGGHALDGVYYGDKDDVSRILSPLLEKSGGALSIQPGTWIQGLEYYAEGNCLTPSTDEQGNFYATSLTLNDLRDEALASFVHYWHNRAISSQAGGWFVQLDIHGGVNSAVSAVPNSATAYAHRDKTFLVQFYHFSRNNEPYQPGDISMLKKWIEVTTASLQDGDYGMYINYSDSELDRGAAQKLYWASNLERLRLIKKRYDPTELFYYPQSIEPSESK